MLLPPQAILLDDDDLISRTWALAAKTAGIRLLTFRDGASFLAALDTCPKEIDIFLDLQLGGGESGETFARLAFEKGFRSLFLATGMPPDAFPPSPWIRGIVGKDPPWQVLAR